MKATLKIDDKEIEVEITEEELKKFEKKKPNRKRWRAEKKQEYWLAEEAIDNHYIDNYNNLNEYDYSIGNYFQTKEEAEFHKNELIYTQMLKDYIYEHDDVELDWNNYNQCKCFMRYAYLSRRIAVDCVWRSKSQGTIFASNMEVLKDAIKFIGEENVKKYILKVEE